MKTHILAFGCLIATCLVGCSSDAPTQDDAKLRETLSKPIDAHIVGGGHAPTTMPAGASRPGKPTTASGGTPPSAPPATGG